MSTDATKTLLTRFLCATELEVLSWFAGLQGAYISKSSKYVYIPGRRDDRILLVAHADTAGKKNDEGDIAWIGDICMKQDALYDSWCLSGSLGADDRAGCAMLWNNHDGQHSVLITTGEEKGLLGAKAASSELGKELQKHVFSIEIDRRGDRHAVFYDIATPEFKAYMLKLLNDNNPDGPPWKEKQGSCTDISYICESTRICGVNLSAGYLREHSSDEMLLLTAWLNTQATLAGILREAKHLPFRLAKEVKVAKASCKSSWGEYDWCGEHVCYKMECRNKHRQVHTTIVLPSGKKLEIPFSVSKRGFKKFGRKVRRLVDRGELTKGEGERFTQELQDRRDGKPGKRLEVVSTLPETGETWANYEPTKLKPTNLGFKERIYCSHYCELCGEPWKHLKPRSGACKVKQYDSRCPGHSKENFHIVRQYEIECKCPAWASALRLAASTEPELDAAIAAKALGERDTLDAFEELKNGDGIAQGYKEGDHNIDS